MSYRHHVTDAAYKEAVALRQKHRDAIADLTQQHDALTCRRLGMTWQAIADRHQRSESCVRKWAKKASKFETLIKELHK